jgi:hypothetical protein
MGDGNRNSYRSTESLLIVPDTKQDTNFFRDTGLTKNYGFGSPANGSTLSSLDEDGIANDCHLWNNSGQASFAGFTYNASYPYAHQGQVEFTGSASNPLESQYAPITWDMRTVIDTTNPLGPTGIVNYNHTCYPSHQIKVNGKIVYLYQAPLGASTTYIIDCLYLGLGKVIGQQPTPTTVPLF